ncbi:MAG: hypothetical protein ABI833_12640 [Acidobacteriota bacterium]
MFHWICPECGREIAPTVRECPVCDPVAATVETAPAGEVEAPARAAEEAASRTVAASAPSLKTQPEPAQPIEIQPAPMAYEALAPAVEATTTVVAPVDNAPSVLAAPIASVSPLAARGSQRIAEQDADSADALLPEFGTSSGGGDPMGHLSSMLVSSMLDSIRDPADREPPQSRDSLPLPMHAASNVPASLRAFIAELRPAGAEPRIPSTPDQRPQTAPKPPLLTNTIPLPLRPSRQVLAPSLGAKLLVLPVPSQDVVLPWSRPLEAAPPLAALGDYRPLEGRPLRPAIPKLLLLKKECGPRTTLPGPMLTRRLVKFVDREFRTIPPAFLRPNKRLIPGWMATALILGTLLGAGFTSVISVVRPAAEAKPSTTVQTDTAPEPAAATPAAASVSVSPLAKAIEVTGFRIQLDPTKKSEIQYLVVNHTPARFSGATVFVTLYTADAKAGQPPLCKFVFTAPSLAPFQSKDMASAIESVTLPVSLPDWQDLRASVEITE